MTYRQDDSYALAAHVSWGIRQLLGRHYDFPTAWSITRQLWTCAILDSREPTIEKRPPGWKPRPLAPGHYFLDAWSPAAKESMLRTWPELVRAFRERHAPSA